MNDQRTPTTIAPIPAKAATLPPNRDAAFVVACGALLLVFDAVVELLDAAALDAAALDAALLDTPAEDSAAIELASALGSTVVVVVVPATVLVVPVS